jgi:hypothetical protein
MRDPDIFKYDVRVRDRMLRAGRITTEEIARVLDALPDLDASLEIVTLNQPALDAAAVAAASAPRQSVPPPNTSEDDSLDDDSEDGDVA